MVLTILRLCTHWEVVIPRATKKVGNVLIPSFFDLSLGKALFYSEMMLLTYQRQRYMCIISLAMVVSKVHNIRVRWE